MYKFYTFDVYLSQTGDTHIPSLFMKVVLDIRKQGGLAGAIIPDQADLFRGCVIRLVLKLDELPRVRLFPDDDQGVDLERI